MHQTVKNLLNIQEKVKENINQNKLRINPNIIAVSKTFEGTRGNRKMDNYKK